MTGEATAQRAGRSMTDFVGEERVELLLRRERGPLVPRVQECHLDDARRECRRVGELTLRARQASVVVGVKDSLERLLVGEHG